MKESFSIKFYLNQTKSKEDKFQIYARIIVDREKVELATKQYVRADQWSEDAGRTTRASAINDELAEMENEIRRIRRKILDDGKALSAKALKQHYKGDKTFKVRLLEYFEKHLDELAQFSSVSKISEGTVKNYRTTLKHLSSFVREQKRMADVDLNEIDYGFINEFDLYLKTVYTSKLGLNICNNHANKQHSRVRTILHRAVRDGIIATNPYNSFRLKADKTDRGSTHSMGGAYGKGFVAAIKNYIRFNNDPAIRKVLIELIADFDPYQAGDLEADPETKTMQFVHKKDWNILGMGWLANEEEKGIDKENVHTNTGTSTDHSISTFFNDISKLEEGTYKWTVINGSSNDYSKELRSTFLGKCFSRWVLLWDWYS